MFRKWLPSLGPLYRYDLVRTSRSGHLILHRCIYIGLLVVAVSWAYGSAFPDFDLTNPFGTVPVGTVSRENQSVEIQKQTRFASSFFATFMTMQLALIALVTPAYIAGSIAKERECGTLDFLMVTDLRNYEIVLGILASRLFRLALLVLSGLPLVSLLPFLGGVDPALVLTGFAVSVLLMLSLGSLSMMMSVSARTALGAVVRTYAITLAFFVFSTMLCPPCIINPVWNVLFPMSMTDADGTGTSLLVRLLVFGAAQGINTLFCCLAAIGGLREKQPEWAMRPENMVQGEEDSEQVLHSESPIPRIIPPPPTSEAITKGLAEGTLLFGLPKIGRDALLWKETHVGSYLGYLTRAGILVPLAVLLFPLILIVGWAGESSWIGMRHHEFGGHPPGPAMFAGIRTGLGYLILLAVAVSSSGRISGEREGHTLETLLCLPVSRWEFAFSKWLGSMLAARKLFYALALVTLLGGITYSNVFSSLLIGATWMISAGFLAGLGLWLSSVSRSTLRATLLITLVVFYFIIDPLRLMGITFSPRPATNPPGLTTLFLDYLTCPGSLPGAFSLSISELSAETAVWETLKRMLAAVAALHVYLLAIPIFLIATIRGLRP